jgi:hypothetical protein
MLRNKLLKEKVQRLYFVTSEDDEFMKSFKTMQYWHVSLVAEYAKFIYEKENSGDFDLIVAGVWTHDISDAIQYRLSRGNDEVNDKLQKQVMLESGYSEEDIDFVKSEITDVHGCKEFSPTKIEGKIVASADAMAHLKSYFYLRFCWAHMPKGKVESLEDYKTWVLDKIERDFKNKIFFDWLKEDMEKYYISLKTIFTS